MNVAGMSQGGTHVSAAAGRDAFYAAKRNRNLRLHNIGKNARKDQPGAPPPSTPGVLNEQHDVCY